MTEQTGTIDTDRDREPGPDADLPSAPDRVALLRDMIRIRRFEERVIADYLARKIPGFTHSYMGEEAVAVGACAALAPTDLITSTHRGHGHAIAKGVALRPMMAELYGRVDGTCRGRGGSMHIADFSAGMLGANGIVGGGFGLAAGATLAARFKGTPEVCISFFGDGAINKGSFHEALNFSAVQRLPVVFLCENNQYGQYTAVERVTAVSDLRLRAAGYGIPGERVDGNDVLAVLAATTRAVARARAGDGPTLLIADTYRFGGHSVGDPEVYRSKAEVAERRLQDPIDRYVTWLRDRGDIDDDGLASLEARAAAEVEDAAAFAAASPEPDAATALDDLFASTRADWSND